MHMPLEDLERQASWHAHHSKSRPTATQLQRLSNSAEARGVAHDPHFRGHREATELPTGIDLDLAQVPAPKPMSLVVSAGQIVAVW